MEDRLKKKEDKLKKIRQEQGKDDEITRRRNREDDALKEKKKLEDEIEKLAEAKLERTRALVEKALAEYDRYNKNDKKSVKYQDFLTDDVMDSHIAIEEADIVIDDADESREMYVADLTERNEEQEAEAEAVKKEAAAKRQEEKEAAREQVRAAREAQRANKEKHRKMAELVTKSQIVREDYLEKQAKRERN